MTSDEALLARQAALQKEAAGVITDLDLFRLLGAVGRPVQTGSVALGLMVDRDIDVTVLCPALDTTTMFDALRPIASHPRVRQMQFRNDTGHWNTDPDYPDGLYWGLRYRSEQGDEWTLDLWFLREGTTQFDLRHIESLPPRLTREARVAILGIKEARHRLPAGRSEVRSYHIYEAVLDHGVQTPEEFEAHLRARGQDQGKPSSG